MWRKKKRRGMRTYLIAVIIDDARHDYEDNHRKWTYEKGSSENYSIIDRIVRWRGRDRTLLGEGRKQMNINIILMNSERALTCMYGNAVPDACMPSWNNLLHCAIAFSMQSCACRVCVPTVICNSTPKTDFNSQPPYI